MEINSWTYQESSTCLKAAHGYQFAVERTILSVALSPSEPTSLFTWLAGRYSPPARLSIAMDIRSLSIWKWVSSFLNLPQLSTRKLFFLRVVVQIISDDYLYWAPDIPLERVESFTLLPIKWSNSHFSCFLIHFHLKVSWNFHRIFVPNLAHPRFCERASMILEGRSRKEESGVRVGVAL